MSRTRDWAHSQRTRRRHLSLTTLVAHAVHAPRHLQRTHACIPDCLHSMHAHARTAVPFQTLRFPQSYDWLSNRWRWPFTALHLCLGSWLMNKSVHWCKLAYAYPTWEHENTHWLLCFFQPGMRGRGGPSDSATGKNSKRTDRDMKEPKCWTQKFRGGGELDRKNCAYFWRKTEHGHGTTRGGIRC